MPILSRARVSKVCVSKVCVLALIAAGFGGCQSIGNAIGGVGGVMPESDVGPPPSMRGAVKGQMSGTPQSDEDGNPLPSTPTRQLALPKSAGGAGRTAEAAPRRINREDLDGGNGAVSRGRSSSGMTPSLTPSGGVGLGGQF